MLNQAALQGVLLKRGSGAVGKRAERWDATRRRVEGLRGGLIAKTRRILRGRVEKEKKELSSSGWLMPGADRLIVRGGIGEMEKGNMSLRDELLLKGIDDCEKRLVKELMDEAGSGLCGLLGDCRLHVERAKAMHAAVRMFHRDLSGGEISFKFTKADLEDVSEAMLELAEQETLLSRDLTHVTICSLVLGVQEPPDISAIVLANLGRVLMNADTEALAQARENSALRRGEVAVELLELLYPGEAGELINEVFGTASAGFPAVINTLPGQS